MPSWYMGPPRRSRPLLRLLMVLAGIAVFAWLTGRAVDHEYARAHGGSSIAAIRAVFPAATENAAIRVARCESRLYARAANWRDRHSDGSRGSFGLFQIGALHRARGESVAAFARRMFDPVANARVAYRLSRGGRNWRPWTCRP